MKKRFLYRAAIGLFRLLLHILHSIFLTQLLVSGDKSSLTRFKRTRFFLRNTKIFRLELLSVHTNKQVCYSYLTFWLLDIKNQTHRLQKSWTKSIFTTRPFLSIFSRIKFQNYSVDRYKSSAIGKINECLSCC